MEWLWNGGYELRSSADTSGRVRQVLEKLEATDQDQIILRLVANSPNVFRPFVLLANSLVNQAALGASEREALVLHLAAKENAPYEANAHLEPAAQAGLSPRQIEVLVAGNALDEPDLFSPAERLCIELGERVAEGGTLSEDDWSAAHEAFGREGALDLVFSVAWWAGFVLHFTRALGLRPAGESTAP